MSARLNSLKRLSYFRNVRIVKNGWTSFALTVPSFKLRVNIRLVIVVQKIMFRSGGKAGLTLIDSEYLNRLFHALRHVGKRHPESLDRRERILKV